MTHDANRKPFEDVGGHPVPLTDLTGMRTKRGPAKGDGVNTCRTCGAEDLFDGYFVRGLAVTGGDEPGAKHRIVCNHCGKFQR
jgi:hypothetical protein